MKPRRTLMSLSIAFLLIVAVSIPSVLFFTGKAEQWICSQLLRMSGITKGNVTLTIGSAERQTGRGIIARDISVDVPGSNILTVGSMTVDVDLGDVWHIIVGKYSRCDLTLSADEVRVNLDDISLSRLKGLAEKTQAKDKNGRELTISDIPALTVEFTGITADIDIEGFEAHTSDIGCSLAARSGLDFTAAWLYGDLLTAVVDGQEATLKGLKVLAAGNRTVTLSAESASYGEIAAVGGLSAKASFDIDLNVTEASASFERASFSMDGIGVSSETVDASMKNINGTWSVLLGAKHAQAQYAEYSASLDSMELSGKTSDFKSGIGTLSAGLLTTGEIGIAYVEESSLEGITIPFDFADGRLGASISSLFHAKATEEFPVAYVDGYIDASATLNLDGVGISGASVSITDVKVPGIESPMSLSASYARNKANTLDAVFKYGSSLYVQANYDLSSGKAWLILDADGMKLSEFESYYSQYVPFLGGIIDGTSSFDSHIEAFLTVSDDTVVDASLSFDSTVANLVLAGSHQSATIEMDARLDEEKVSFDSFSFEAMNLELGFSGSVNRTGRLPQGRITLVDLKDGGDIINSGFTLSQDGRYIIDSTVSKYLPSRFAGEVAWNDSDNIDAELTLFTDYGTYPMSVVVDTSDFTIQARGENFSLDGILDRTSLFSMDLRLNNVPLHFTDDLMTNARGMILADYSFSEGTWHYGMKDFELSLVDIVSVGFDMSLSDNGIYLDDVEVRSLTNPEIDMVGSASLACSSLKELFADFRTNATIDFDFTDNLSQTDVIRGTFAEGLFYADVKSEAIGPVDLSIMGGNGNGYFASGSVMGFSFDARLYDDVLRFSNCSGDILSLDFRDTDISIDIDSMVVHASTSFTNTMDNYTGEAKQGGTVSFTAEVMPIVKSLLKLKSDDLRFTASLSLRDVFLADGFTCADTDLNMVYDNGTITAEGNMMNGVVDLDRGFIDFVIDDSFLVGLHACGYFSDGLDLAVSDIKLPVGVINQFINFPIINVYDTLVEGDLLLKGSIENPMIYGSLICKSMDMELLYTPDQIINVRNLRMMAEGKSITASSSCCTITGKTDNKFCEADVSAEILIDGLSLSSAEVNLNTKGDDRYDFWFPLDIEGLQLDIHGLVNGDLTLFANPAEIGIRADITLDDGTVDFKIDDAPDWFYKMPKGPMSLDLQLTVGKNFDFAYPDRDNPLINFTFEEGEVLNLLIDAVDGTFQPGGSLSFKTGQVYYFKNDFIVTEGDLSITRPMFSPIGSIAINLNLKAKLREYDKDGNLVDIYLILQDASLDNIAPRFESSNNLTETEIIEIITQSVVSDTLGNGFSASSVASLAATATEALSRLGILESNQQNSFTATMRELLGLDVFSIKSSILENIIVYALPGRQSSSSLLARYLNGTSLFTGKYLNHDIFLRASMQLKENDGSNTTQSGHFLTDDLDITVELSLEWENPLGTFTISTRPQELAVYDFLDTVGFSFSKSIQF